MVKIYRNTVYLDTGAREVCRGRPGYLDRVLAEAQPLVGPRRRHFVIPRHAFTFEKLPRRI
jgi:hypothetical protein